MPRGAKGREFPLGQEGKAQACLGAPKGTNRQPEAQATLEARTAALVAAWLVHPATVQPEQMSDTERRRFHSGMAKLPRSSLTLEELPALLDAQVRRSRGTYTPDPHTMDASPGTLRREAAARNQPGAASETRIFLCQTE